MSIWQLVYFFSPSPYGKLRLNCTQRFPKRSSFLRISKDTHGFICLCVQAFEMAKNSIAENNAVFLFCVYMPVHSHDACYQSKCIISAEKKCRWLKGNVVCRFIWNSANFQPSSNCFPIQLCILRMYCLATLVRIDKVIEWVSWENGFQTLKTTSMNFLWLTKSVLLRLWSHTRSLLLPWQAKFFSFTAHNFSLDVHFSFGLGDIFSVKWSNRKHPAVNPAMILTLAVCATGFR